VSDGGQHFSDGGFRERMRIGGGLNMTLREYLWGHGRDLRLGGHDFEVVGCEDVPGYEDEDAGVFLRREADGVIFVAEIEVGVERVLTPVQRENRLNELRGQLRLPGVA
jgi:hypothetical protein